MKKLSLSMIVYLSILICNIMNCNAFSTLPFTIEHISTNYNRIVEHNGRIVIAGDLGNLVYSDDQAQTWNRSQLENAFDNIDISSIDNQLLILGKNNGYYAYSNAKFMLFINENKSDKWKSKAIYSNLIPHFEKNDKEYYLASQDSLFIFNTSLQINALALSNILKTTSQDTLINFKIFKNNFYFLFKNGKLISTNDKFEILDDPYYFKEIDECKSCMTTNQLEVSEFNNHVYITVSTDGFAYTYLKNNKIYALSVNSSRIYLENDKIKFYTGYVEDMFKTQKEMLAYDEFSFIDSSYIYDYMRNKEFIMKDLKVNDYFEKGNVKLLVGKNNLIFKIDGNNKTWAIINNLVNLYNPNLEELNNKILIKNPYQDFYSSENGDFWKPMISTKIFADSLQDANYTSFSIDENRSFTLYNLSDIFYFKSNFIFYNKTNSNYVSKRWTKFTRSDFESMNGKIITNQNLILSLNYNYKNDSVMWNELVVVDSNLNEISKNELWNKKTSQLFYVHNKLSMICINYKNPEYDTVKRHGFWDKDLYLFTSSDNGNTWDSLYLTSFGKEYLNFNIRQTPLYIDNKLVFNVIYTINDTTNSEMFKLDFQTLKTNRIIYFNDNSLFKMPFSLQDTFYFSGRGSNYLYYFKENKLEENNIDSLDLSSYFASKFLFSLVNIHKNEDVYTKLILTPASGNVNMLVRLTKKNKNIISSIDDENKVETSMYAYKPYPLPSKDFVFTKIYWDMSLDIDKSDITVFDIYGNKVADKSEIVVNKEQAFSGTLEWNCQSVGSGVYLIVIQHGDTQKTIRVLVEK